MANYSNLNSTINAVVRTNGNEEITGENLNGVLRAMVSVLGAGYQFMGTATASTNPGTPDARVFYLAIEAGTYSIFGGTAVTEPAIFYYDTTWHYQTLSGNFDSVNNISALLGYYECSTGASTAAKTITASHYVLRTGGAMTIKFTNKNTATAHVTLNINSTGPKPLYYQGSVTSDTNSWADGEVCEVYYDGTNYYATPVLQKFGSGELLKDIHIIDNLSNNSATDVLSAKQGKQLNETKLDKIKYVDQYDEEIVHTTWTGQYLDYEGIHREATGYTTKQYAVTPGQTLYITGSTGTSASNAVAVFVNTLSGNSSSPAIYVGEAIGVGANVTMTKQAVTVPEGAVGVRVMQADSKISYPALVETKTEIPAYNNQERINSIGDIDELETTNKETVVDAINEIKDGLDEVVTDKLDAQKTIEIVTYNELEPASGEGITGTFTDKYLGNKAAVSTGSGNTVKQFAVTPGQTIYITGSTGTSSTNYLAFFINDFTKTGGGSSNSGGITNGGVESGANIYRSRLEVVVPEGAIGVRIMQRNSVTDYPIKCETKTISYEYIDNQERIDSIGDITELHTENKDTVVDAINELDGKIGKKSLKVLLIGSSHGLNTISMFPVLAYHAGIDIICGNLYAGSATLGLYATKPTVQIPYMADNDVAFDRFAVFENGAWTTKTTKTVAYALGLYDWDIIILQRGASEDDWNDSLANFYQHLLNYIKDNCDYTPRIYFNSGIADARSTLSNCLSDTNTIMTTAMQQYAEFGIEVIPTAVAVQYARSTCLKETGQTLGSDPTYKMMAADSQHLDTGVGQYVTACCVFEKIVKDVFNMSVRELKYLPVYSDVANNVVPNNTGSTYFTPITDYYSRIAKTCAALAVIDKVYNADTKTMLAARYGSLPSTYNITYNLTGCTLDVEDATIDSDEVFMAKLTLSDGYTMPSGGVVVTMGGVDITSSVYATHDGYYAIRIGEISGDIVITATAILSA